jgi:hypothetical protein
MRFFFGTEVQTPVLRRVLHLHAPEHIDDYDPGSFDENTPRAQYITNIALPHNWVGHHETHMVAQLTHMRIEIFNGFNTTIIEPLDGVFYGSVTVLYSNNNHYDLAVPIPGFPFLLPQSPDLAAAEQGLLMSPAHPRNAPRPVWLLFNSFFFFSSSLPPPPPLSFFPYFPLLFLLLSCRKWTWKRTAQPWMQTPKSTPSRTGL